MQQDLPPVLVGDPLRLGQILINLVNNAVKFTEHGEIVVAAKLEERVSDRVKLKFTVRDSGIGMTPEQIARLFRRSVRPILPQLESTEAQDLAFLFRSAS